MEELKEMLWTVMKEDALLYLRLFSYIMKVENDVAELEIPNYPCYKVEEEW